MFAVLTYSCLYVTKKIGQNTTKCTHFCHFKIVCTYFCFLYSFIVKIKGKLAQILKFSTFLYEIW
jgi:hypothetical protein